MTDTIAYECPECGHVTKKHKHGMTQRLIAALRSVPFDGSTFKLSACLRDRSLLDNFQKLRYWGLVRQVDGDGMWQVTDRGRRFLRGESSEARFAWTVNGHTVDTSPERVTVSTAPWGRWKRRDEYAADAEAIPPDEIP